MNHLGLGVLLSLCAAASCVRGQEFGDFMELLQDPPPEQAAILHQLTDFAFRTTVDRGLDLRKQNSSEISFDGFIQIHGTAAPHDTDAWITIAKVSSDAQINQFLVHGVNTSVHAKVAAVLSSCDGDGLKVSLQGHVHTIFDEKAANSEAWVSGDVSLNIEDPAVKGKGLVLELKNPGLPNTTAVGRKFRIVIYNVSIPDWVMPLADLKEFRYGKDLAVVVNVPWARHVGVHSNNVADAVTVDPYWTRVSKLSCEERNSSNAVNFFGSVWVENCTSTHNVTCVAGFDNHTAIGILNGTNIAFRITVIQTLGTTRRESGTVAVVAAYHTKSGHNATASVYEPDLNATCTAIRNIKVVDEHGKVVTAFVDFSDLTPVVDNILNRLYKVLESRGSG